jgi:hypothetical protein
MGPTLFHLFVITEYMFQYTLSTKQNTKLCSYFNCISLEQHNLEGELSVSDGATAQHDAAQT